MKFSRVKGRLMLLYSHASFVFAVMKISWFFSPF